ncbi:hypothetical protein AZE42_03868 [Rhizopogon vesiculosus]|uniref:F-box domain-containing protein n=1 Tax=Rhizopogon vesiculosus TaxID=180088 RepID=A0A1J8QFA7_9AGAM|nr:hypothetical protein AZE42_03868 [Rhizopogon vesiculosus]
MHQALYIAEIVHEISRHTGTISLPRLASTCRALQVPALDALWRDLPSVTPFIHCLPTHLWNSSPQEEGEPMDPFQAEAFAPAEPANLEAWTTFRKYTSRVHSITQSQNVTPLVIEQLGLLILSYPFPSESVFQNLQRLAWHVDYTPYALDFLRVAFVPSLESLDIRLTSNLMLLLSTLRKCPNLTSFRAQMNDWKMADHRIAPVLTRMISQLHHLSTFSVGELGDQEMVRVMRLQSLKTLWLYVGEYPYRRTELPIDLRPSMSQSGRHYDLLRLSGQSEQPGHMLQFCSMLREKRDAEALEVITLRHYIYIAVPTPLIALSLLRLFGDLTQLNIENACIISISDHDLCNLVQTWP